MVGSPIHHHVGLLHHVAFDAQSPVAGFSLVSLLVEVVIVAVVYVCPVALATELIALIVEL